MKAKTKKKNPLLWLFEPLENDPRYEQRRLFMMAAAYLDGRLYAAVNDGKEPWSGLMVCTAKQHHPSLLLEFAQLVPHQILGKWLYISQSHPEFESVATDIIALALRRDPRLGVESSSSHGRKPSMGA